MLKRWKEKLSALKIAVQWTYESSQALTLIILCVSVLGGLLTFLEPYVFKLLIDAITQDAEQETRVGLGIVGVLVLYGVARITQGLFWDINNLIRRVHSLRMERHALCALIQKITSLDLAYFEGPSYYDTLSRATANLWRVIEVFWVVTFLTSEAISVIVSMIALAAFDWRLVLIVLLGTIPSLLSALKWADVLWSAFAEASPIYRHAAYYRSLLTEQPEAIKEVKTLGLQEYFLKKFRNLFTVFITKQDRAARGQFKWYAFIGGIEGTLSVVAAALIVQAFMNKTISIGDVTFLWAILFQFASHVRWIVRMVGDTNTHATFLTPLVAVFNLQPRIKDPTQPLAFPKVLKKGIEFKNVTFQYQKKIAALRDVSFSIKPGESVALVGENGSGKTTLVKLLCRLYDVSHGEILIDGVNIKQFCLADLYNNMGTIFQDFMKYETLLEENIKYGRLNIRGHAKVHEAAVKAGAWGFIKHLGKKYKTHVGRKMKKEGVDLSVGQWQKVALARAFFRDAQILILDEPTAAVDAKAEYELFTRFRKLTKNKITLLISHRFSTVRMADKIIVMDKGRIIETGSHDELMKKKGHYAQLFTLQAKGYR